MAELHVFIADQESTVQIQKDLAPIVKEIKRKVVPSAVEARKLDRQTDGWDEKQKSELQQIFSD